MLEKRNGMPVTLLERVSMAAVADGTAFSIQENSIFVATVSASTLSGNALVFSIAGGADAALFYVDETSGDLGFLSPPDFETPGDENRDNAYFVEILISNGISTETRFLEVAVLDQFGADIRANEGDNYIVATGEQDYVEAYGGADTILGFTGDDRLYGGAGNDSLDGGPGNDALEGSDYTLPDAATLEDDDLIRGGDGFDYIDGGFGQDTVFGGNDGDYVRGGAGNDSIQGETGDDRLFGEVGNDTLLGGDGNDQLVGSDGDDINATDENDSLLGGAGDDFIEGYVGSDTLLGGARADVLRGGAGDDLLDGGEGVDTIVGGNGLDTASYVNATARVLLSLEPGAQNPELLQEIENLRGSIFNDQLIGNGGGNVLTGEAGNDTLLGGAGVDTLRGGSGNDLLAGGSEADVIDGGTGLDTASYSDATAAVNVSLESAGTNPDQLIGIEGLLGSVYDDRLAGNNLANTLTGNAGRDTLSGALGNDTLSGGIGADELRGGVGSDLLSGGADADRLVGGGGADTLRGGDGADRLTGGTGNDLLEGGLGADRFLFNVALSATGNLDTVSDFARAQGDVLQLDDDIFLSLAGFTGGSLPTGRFQALSGVNEALGSEVRVVYNTTTGALFYDSDGSGSESAVKFALLTGAPVLTAADILIVI